MRRLDSRCSSRPPCAAAVAARRRRHAREPVALDAGRRSSTRRASLRAADGTDQRRRRSQQAFQGPLGAELRADRPRALGRPGVGRLQRPVLRAPDRRAGCRGRARAGGRRPRDARHLGRRLRGRRSWRSSALLLLRFGCRSRPRSPPRRRSLPALRHHAGFPLTDSWGAGARDGRVRVRPARPASAAARWLIAWARCIVVLSFTRDSAWIPVLAAALASPSRRGRGSRVRLLGTGLAAALPVLLLFSVPMRELLAMMLNGVQPGPTRRGASSPSATRARSSTCCRPTAATSATAPGSPPPTCSAVSALLFVLRRAAPASAGRHVPAGGARSPASLYVWPSRSSARSGWSSCSSRWRPSGWRSGSSGLAERHRESRLGETPASPARRSRPSHG